MEESGKLYYGIREVAEMFGINASKLRYYEKEFDTLQPRKTGPVTGSTPRLTSTI